MITMVTLKGPDNISTGTQSARLTEHLHRAQHQALPIDIMCGQTERNEWNNPYLNKNKLTWGRSNCPSTLYYFVYLKYEKKEKRSNHLYIQMHNFTHLTKYPESQEDHKTTGQFSIFIRGPFYSVVFFLLLFLPTLVHGWVRFYHILNVTVCVCVCVCVCVYVCVVHVCLLFPYNTLCKLFW